MNEIIFYVEPAQEGGFIAKAISASIFTQAETTRELREMVRDAVKCHFDAESMPKVIRLQYVREEVLSVF